MGESHVRRSILLLPLLWAGSTDAAVEHISIQSNLELKPGDAHVITVEATQPTEIGWQVVRPTPCVTDCVEATDVTGGINYAITTRLGASMKYNCVPSVKRYLSERTPKDRYSPYIISGQAIGDADAVVLTSIETCAPKAPNFGVPEENVFK